MSFVVSLLLIILPVSLVVTVKSLETRAVQQIFPQISTGYVSAALRLRSGFAPPSAIRQSPQVAFWVRHGAVRETTGVARPRSPRNNHMITHDRSYRSVLLKTTTQCVPDWRISRRACVCLGGLTRSVLLNNRKLFVISALDFRSAPC